MSDIPEETKRFIAAHISSVEQLEVLLLLRSDSDGWWVAEDVSRELATQPRSASLRLEDLRARGLLTTSDEDRHRFRYRPETPELDAGVSALADAYAKRRITVISLIFADPNYKIRTFADAFRLREERNDG